MENKKAGTATGNNANTIIHPIDTEVNYKLFANQYLKVSRRSDPEWSVCCPIHDDSHASASYNIETGQFCCHACGANTKHLKEHFGIKTEKTSSKREIARYDYQDENGKILFQQVRKELPNGEKTFSSYNPNTKEWTIKGVRRVPYHLPRLIDGIREGKTIFITEGEKDVHTLEKLGCIATTNPGGAGNWREEYSAYIPQGHRVIIAPDADEPGQDHVQQVKDSLPGRNVSVLNFGYPIVKKHGRDVSDWIAEGHTREEFDRLIAEAKQEQQPSEPRKSTIPDSDQHCKDYGHACILVEEFRNKYRYAVHRQKFLEYDGKKWSVIPIERLSKIASDTLQEIYIEQARRAITKEERSNAYASLRDANTYARIQGALCFLRGFDGILTNPEEWDSDPWLLNVNNGTIDLKTCELNPHDPNDLITHLAPVDFDPSAEAALWQSHLDLFMPNKNIQRQIQRDIGISLVGTCLDEFLPIWYGTGANAKTTTSRIIQNLLGDYAIKAAPNLLLQQKYERHPTEVADLCGSRLVFSVEVEKGKRLAESTVKDLTGGDRKKARRMREDFFEFEQTFSIFLLVNDRPVITGTDPGIWRRVRLVPWTVRVPEEKKKPQDEVITELLTEDSGILTWILAGLLDWQNDHNWIADEVRTATEEYRSEEDRLGGFLRDCCEIKRNVSVTVSALYSAYEAYCTESGEDAYSKKYFGKLMRERGFEQGTLSHEKTRIWKGIRLMRTNADDDSISPSASEKTKDDMENVSASVRKNSEEQPNFDEVDDLFRESKGEGYE